MRQISFKLEIFEGPLDLLLHLINKNRLSLYDIPISEITEQYIDYLSEMEHFDIEVSSDFLVLAATLLYIKSKMLLPKYDAGAEEEEDPRVELTRRLLEYKRFKQAAIYLTERETAGANIYYRMRDYIEPVLIDESLSQLTAAHLSGAFAELCERVRFRRPVSAKAFTGIVGRELISVFSRVKLLLSNLKLFKKMRFLDVFRGTKSRGEAVASFLAVLELIKMNRTKVSGSGAEVEIKYINLKKGVPDGFGDTEDTSYN